MTLFNYEVIGMGPDYDDTLAGLQSACKRRNQRKGRNSCFFHLSSTLLSVKLGNAHSRRGGLVV